MPIVCVLGVRRKLSSLAVHLLEETVNGMPGCQFLNLTVIADDEAGNALVRHTLMQHLEPLPPAAGYNPTDPAPTTIP